MSSPIKVRAKTSPVKWGHNINYRKNSGWKKGRRKGVKKSACQPLERASMNDGLVAGSRLKYDSTRGVQYIEIPLTLIQASHVQN